MWGPDDIPPQRPEHEGMPVTYKADGNGLVHEVPAARTAAHGPGAATYNNLYIGEKESDRLVPRDAPPVRNVDGVSVELRGTVFVPDHRSASGMRLREMSTPVTAEELADIVAHDTLSGGELTEDDLLRGLEDLYPRVDDPLLEGAIEALRQGPIHIEMKHDERQRQWLPTLAELVDRMVICRLKAVFVEGSKDAYEREIADIRHDIDLILDQKSGNGFVFGAEAIHAAVVITLANRYIWENEAKARAGGSEQDHLLKLTHSINGVRNTAKNVLSKLAGDRIDLKIDCFAADLAAEFGNWNIFGSTGAA